MDLKGYRMGLRGKSSSAMIECWSRRDGSNGPIPPSMSYGYEYMNLPAQSQLFNVPMKAF